VESVGNKVTELYIFTELAKSIAIPILATVIAVCILIAIGAYAGYKLWEEISFRIWLRKLKEGK